jgi:CBS domain containing-hemolysin-like protein
MDLVLILSLVVAFALVLLNGVFVAAEFAIVRVRRTRLEELAGHGREDAKHAIELVDRVDEYLATTQLGITAASLGVGWLGEGAFARLFVWLVPDGASISITLVHVIATVLAFGLVTITHVVLGELVPKNIALTKADHLLMRLARPLRLLHLVLGPASRILNAVAGWIQRGFGHESMPPPALSEDELKLVLHDSHEEGVLTAGEAKIILRAFEFADRCAEEIMVPAELVDFLSLSRSFEENLATARTNLHARLPLCETDLDSVRGVVSMKDLWLLRSEDSNAAFERVCRPFTTIGPDLSQEAILRRFQEEGAQIGIVREHGTTLGIVTLEDVLESLLGDVRESRSPESRPPAPAPATTTGRG